MSGACETSGTGPMRLENSMAVAAESAFNLKHVQVLQAVQSARIVVKQAVAEYEDLVDSTSDDLEMLVRIMRSALANIDEILKVAHE